MNGITMVLQLLLQDACSGILYHGNDSLVEALFVRMIKKKDPQEPAQFPHVNKGICKPMYQICKSGWKCFTFKSLYIASQISTEV